MGWDTSTRKQRLPHNWAALRAHTLTRYGHQCGHCGAPARQVDHIVPDYLGGTDNEANLIALCDDCHTAKTTAEGHHGMRLARARTLRAAPKHPGMV